MELIRIKPDAEKAKSLLQLAVLRISKLPQFNMEKESSLIAESYYEICKELITAVLFLDGYKTLSHKDLIEYLGSKHKDSFVETEIETINSLRKRRNRIVYYGVFVDPSYLKRNQKIFEEIISKLRKIIDEKLI